MNLRLYGRVIWRFKVIMALGLIIGVGGAFMLYEGIGSGAYASKAQVFITQPGFTWGSSGRSGGANDNANPASASGSAAIVSPYVPGVDPARLSSLATLYAQLANGSALRNMLPAAYRNMLNPSAGSPTATLSANPVTASEFASPATLPLVTFWSSAPSPAVATALAAGAATAFQRLVTLQQAGVAPQSRVVGQVVQNATPGKLTGHKSKSLPIMVFLAGLLGAFGLCLALENLRPRGVERERKRKLGRRNHVVAPREMPVGASSSADAHAGDFSFADSTA